MMIVAVTMIAEVIGIANVGSLIVVGSTKSAAGNGRANIVEVNIMVAMATTAAGMIVKATKSTD